MVRSSADPSHITHQLGAVSVDHIRISPAIRASGTFLVGIPAVNQINSLSVQGAIYSSTPLAFVMMILFAVSPVLVSPTLLSLVDPSEVIEEVLPAMRAERPSSAVLMDPEVVARVNI